MKSSEDMVKAMEALTALMKLKDSMSSLRELIENSNNDDDDEEEDSDDVKMAKELEDDHSAMYKWAFQKDDLENGLRKDKLSKIWSKLHPDLPSIKMPLCINNHTGNIALVMQIAPHWYEYKKNNK